MSREKTPGFDFELVAKLSVAAGFKYFQTMNSALGRDAQRYLDECSKLAKESSREGVLSRETYEEIRFWYRGLARALLIYIEGILYVMRQLTLHAAERNEIKISAGEVALLSEVNYTFNAKRKKIRQLKRPNRFLENFILSFDLFPQVLGSSFEIDYGGQGWESMQRLVELRNRLTHPKTPEDTLLIPDTPNLIRDAAVWFFTCMSSLFSSVDREMLEESWEETIAMPEMQQLHREERLR